MDQDLTDRLRRLGLGKGPEGIKPPEQRRAKVENLIPGRLVTDGKHTCFLVENSYPLAHVHGSRPLGSLLGLTTDSAALFSRDLTLKTLTFRDYLFIDTETTGLSGGAGTITFMVGVGFFEGDQFIVYQYFLRSPSDELMMLDHLAEQVKRRPGVVSFNGRSFDIPLLTNRYILNRKQPPFTISPHLDLLHPSRRLWRYSLESCRLTALEFELLGVRRDQADIPSGIIPMIYRDYLISGNAIEMPRIFYHNRIDVISLVELAELVCRSFVTPESILQNGSEWFSIGNWYESLDMQQEAERAYRNALQDFKHDYYEPALSRLGWLLKREDRKEEAAVVWKQLASVEMDDIKGHLELAKDNEWRTGDLEEAARWTRRALDLVEKWPKRLHELARPDLVHRLDRLEKKLGAGK